MGIRDIKRFLRQRGLIKSTPLSDLANKRIAIDASSWVYKHMYVKIKDHVAYQRGLDVSVDRVEVMESMLDFTSDYVKRLLSMSIVPVFVFDGKSPDLKSEVKAEREKSMNTLRTEINAIRQSSTPDIGRLKKLLCRDISPTSDEFEQIKQFIQSLGVPCLQSNTEAEKLCTSLCVEGRCYATLSSDTDCLTLSCPNVFFSMSSDECFESVSLSDVLIDLRMTMETFVDFCIMCGCDYNRRIPGIGVGRSFDLMTKYGSIDKLPAEYCKKKLDTTVLLYKECRAIFAYEKSILLCDGPIVLTPSASTIDITEVRFPRIRCTIVIND